MAKLKGLVAATGFTSSKHYTTLSPSGKVTVDSYLSKYDTLMAKRATLDAEKHALLSQGNSLTQGQKDRLTSIDTELNQISSDIEDLKGQTTDSLSTEDIARDATKKELATQVIATVPAPPKDSYTVVHGIPQKGDIITYMKFTQHLNPYGRKRQCDTDLENLVSIINKSFNNQIGEYQEIVQEITYTVSS
jgi:hypothetical protein